MAWLVAGERVLASAECPTGHRARARGLIGRESFDGAMVLEPCRSIHTFGMRFPIDVAYLDRDGVVLDVHTVAPRRVSMPRWKARTVVEARAGAFERWNLAVGDTLEVTK